MHTNRTAIGGIQVIVPDVAELQMLADIIAVNQQIVEINGRITRHLVNPVLMMKEGQKQ